jgi:hypothetical protein
MHVPEDAREVVAVIDQSSSLGRVAVALSFAASLAVVGAVGVASRGGV